MSVLPVFPCCWHLPVGQHQGAVAAADACHEAAGRQVHIPWEVGQGQAAGAATECPADPKVAGIYGWHREKNQFETAQTCKQHVKKMGVCVKDVMFGRCCNFTQILETSQLHQVGEVTRVQSTDDNGLCPKGWMISTSQSWG